MAEKAFALRTIWTNMVSDACAGGSHVCNEQEDDDIENESESFDEESIQLFDNEERDSFNRNEEESEDESAVEEEFGQEGVASSSEDNAKKKNSSKPGEKKTRDKKKCPLSYCNKAVVNLPRHLKLVHHWQKNQARHALARYGLRKNYEFTSEKNARAGNRTLRKPKGKFPKPYVDYHKRTLCPLQGCVSIVKRLSQHLRKVHKVDPKSEIFKSMLSKAFKFRNKNQKLQLQESMREKNMALKEKSELVHSDQDSDQEVDCNESIYLSSVSENNKQPLTSVLEGNSDSETSESSTKSHTSKNNVTCFLKQVFIWLKSPDGGRQDGKTAKQHTHQIRKILTKIDPEKNMNSLLDLKLLRDVFVKDAEEQYQPKTIKSYLMSLRHFYSYIIAESPKEIQADCHLASKLKEKMIRWSTSYKRTTLKRKWEKMEEDRENLISPEKIQAFETSRAARDAVKLLGQLTEACEMEITMSHYTLIRDYLMVQVSVDNANRAGVLSNMTVEEFCRASKESNRYLVHVLNHKTFHAHGPAQIVLTQHLYNWIKIFIDKVRSKIASPNAKELFLTWNGKKLTCVNKALQSVWNKGEMNTVIHSTLMRKSAVTTCHKRQKGISSNLADLMAHNEDTARRYYRLTEKGESSVKASQALHSVMRKPTTDSPVVKENEAESMRDDESVLSGDMEKVQSQKRNGWDREQVSEICQLFRDEVMERSVNLQTVKEKIAKSSVLCKENARRVYDRIRYEWRTIGKGDTCTVTLPEVGDNLADRVSRMYETDCVATENKVEEDLNNNIACSDIIPPTSFTSKCHSIFTEDNVMTLVHLCHDMTQTAPISKVKIEERLKSDKLGKELLRKMTMSQLVNRLKHERRQRREKEGRVKGV